MPDEMGGLAVAEPEVSAGATESVESGAEVDAGSEVSAEANNQLDSSEQNPDLTAKPGAKTKLSLAEVVKTKGDALKAIDPALPGALRTAAFEQAGLYREFPGGLKEAVALKGAMSEFGGVEGVKESLQTLGEMGTLAQNFLDGKPEFVEELIKESPASFSQMMPDGLAKWKQIDSQGFDHTIAKAIMDTIGPAKVSEALAQIYNAIDAKEGAAVRQELARLYDLFEGIKATSQKAPERKTDPKTEQLTQREQELSAREQRLFIAPIASEGKAQIQTITDREMLQSYQWDKTDAEVKDAVQERVRLEVMGASKKDKGFCREFDRLKERGDSAGLSRHIKNFQERVTPQIVQRVAKLFAVKPKGAGIVPLKKPGVNGNGAGAAPVSKDYVRVAQQPRFSEIDREAMGRDYEDMILGNKAILKGGRRVTWA